ncbi:hypothetical protein F2Q70_00031509 [Brassica cretica]|uniref:Retrotransposon gag domain-containing protein n=1 Tax=Brassica cretica TaxID=69181 RepID=A0A8S9FDH2_BRACR|nr:hypothetical protein F2Q70_00031509 [Brassica cretica]
MSVYNKVGALATRAVGEFPSSNDLTRSLRIDRAWLVRGPMAILELVRGRFGYVSVAVGQSDVFTQIGKDVVGRRLDHGLELHWMGDRLVGGKDEKNSAIWCMTSRHTRRNAQGEFVTLTNQDLARSLRSDRALTKARSLRNDRALTEARSLRSDRALPEAWRYVANEHVHGSVVTYMARSLRSEQARTRLGRYGQQVQAKALNQVTTEIDTRMGNMFTEMNAKYDAVASHIRKIDVQLAQTNESVKRQQGMLPGKSAINPRTEHCNAIEQPFAEAVLVRVYVPKVPYPIPPKHLMDPISAEQLAGFRKMVRRLPQKISFEHAWEIRPLHMFFKNCRESQEEIKALFTEALTPSLKVLPKVDDPGKFVFPCSIAGVKKNENKVMEKGKKSKKHEPLGREKAPSLSP